MLSTTIAHRSMVSARPGTEVLPRTGKAIPPANHNRNPHDNAGHHTPVAGQHRQVGLSEQLRLLGVKEPDTGTPLSEAAVKTLVNQPLKTLADLTNLQSELSFNDPVAAKEFAELHRGQTAFVANDRLLHLAVKKGCRHLATELLCKGASIYTIDDAGHTPLDDTYDYTQPEIRSKFRASGQVEPREVALLHQQKFLSLFFSTKGAVDWNGQKIDLEDGIVEDVQRTLMKYTRSYLGTTVAAADDKKEMARIFSTMSVANKAIESPVGPNMIATHIDKKPITVMHTHSAGHITMGVFLNNHPAMPGKVIYSHINRGYGVRHHATQPGHRMRFNVAWSLDLTALSPSQRKQFVADLARVARMDPQKATAFIYQKLPEKYKVKTITSPDLTTFQKAQTVGNCPASALKGTMKFLFQRQFGNEKGDALFYDMVSRIKARALGDTLKQIEQYKNNRPSRLQKTGGELVRFYEPKVEKRINLKEDGVFLKELKHIIRTLQQEGGSPETVNALKKIVAAALKMDEQK